MKNEYAGMLEWLADRLVHVYGEKPGMDFILAARRMAGEIRTRTEIVSPASLAVRCGPLEIDATGDPLLTGTVRIEGVEQDWISELTLHGKAGELATVTLTGPLLSRPEPTPDATVEAANERGQ